MVHTNKPISGDIGVIGDGLLLGLPGSKIIIFPLHSGQFWGCTWSPALRQNNL
jgi:hypothetical protein